MVGVRFRHHVPSSIFDIFIITTPFIGFFVIFFHSIIAAKKHFDDPFEKYEVDSFFEYLMISSQPILSLFVFLMCVFFLFFCLSSIMRNFGAFLLALAIIGLYFFSNFHLPSERADFYDQDTGVFLVSTRLIFSILAGFVLVALVDIAQRIIVFVIDSRKG